MPGQALAIAMLAHMPKRNGDETTWEIPREKVRFENIFHSRCFKNFNDIRKWGTEGLTHRMLFGNDFDLVDRT